MSYGVTSAGFVSKPRSVILAELEAAARAQYGNDMDVSSDSALGIQLGLMADSVAAAWEQAALTYAQAYPDGATGASFARIARFTSCPRLAATASLVDVTLSGTTGTVVLAGTVFSGGPGTATVQTQAVCTLAAGTGQTRAIATVTGPQTFPAGTIHVIDTPVAGLSAVSQPEDAVYIGTDLELETAWRSRRESALRAAGGASLEGIRAKVLGVYPVGCVNECYVYGNDGDTTDADGIPGHAFEVVARHVTSDTITQAVLDAVLAAKPAGIYAHGTTVGTSLDPNGVLRTTRYTRPTAVNVYVTVAVTTDGTETSNADLVTSVKAAIIAQESRYRIGNNVVSRRLESAVLAIGELVYDVVIHVGLAPAPSGTEVVLGGREVASFDSTRIAVTLTHASDV